MDNAALSALISGVVALTVVSLTPALSKRREQEADWRRLKLDQYKAFVIAYSGIVESRATDDAHARYSDAVNTLNLVAPTKVLCALYDFSDENSFRNHVRDPRRNEELFNVLLNEMRRDIDPRSSRNGSSGLTFRFIGVPPAKETGAEVAGKPLAASG